MERTLIKAYFPQSQYMTQFALMSPDQLLGIWTASTGTRWNNFTHWASQYYWFALLANEKKTVLQHNKRFWKIITTWEHLGSASFSFVDEYFSTSVETISYYYPSFLCPIHLHWQIQILSPLSHGCNSFFCSFVFWALVLPYKYNKHAPFNITNRFKLHYVLCKMYLHEQRGNILHVI